ncbi:hypothetical protein ACFL3C_00715 [Patescibacteria group bacterium]
MTALSQKKKKLRFSFAVQIDAGGKDRPPITKMITVKASTVTRKNGKFVIKAQVQSSSAAEIAKGAAVKVSSYSPNLKNGDLTVN